MKSSVNETYGELLPDAAETLVKHFDKNAHSFLDIGSGKGALLYILARLTSLDLSGVECNLDAFDQSQTEYNKQPIAIRNRIHLWNNDILKLTDISPDIAYMCCTAFSLQLQLSLSRWLNTIARPAQVFSLRPLIEPGSYQFQKRFIVGCSWDNALCYEYRLKEGKLWTFRR